MTGPLVVAIDGPAGSGKSTVAKAIAARLGLEVLDTGSMYRAITALALRVGVDPGDAAKVAQLAEESDLRVADRVVVDDVDLTDELRLAPVNEAVSVVSANPGVRAALVLRQRAWVAEHGGGRRRGPRHRHGRVPRRDRSRSSSRRATRSASAGAQATSTPTASRARDRLDQGRAASPLRRADDAHELDTTGRTPDDVIDEVLSWL